MSFCTGTPKLIDNAETLLGAAQELFEHGGLARNSVVVRWYP